MKRLIILSLLLAFIASCNKPKENAIIEKVLSEKWEFSRMGANEWYHAKVPGTIHADLLNNNLIPHPFDSCNEKELQWIGREDWTYRCTFDVDDKIYNCRNITLFFEGLDTYANVSLNGEEILVANNMHIGWDLDIKDILKKQGNLLEVHFKSAENRFIEDSTAYRTIVPGGRWVFARKAAYHFGWDWGPKYITAGIWQKVSIKASNDFIPEDVFLCTKEITEDKAVIQSLLKVKSDKEQTLSIVISDNKTGKKFFDKDINLQEGTNTFQSAFDIEEPKLWWSNGQGEPYIYDILVELTSESGYYYKEVVPFGIRTIEATFDKDEHGQSFYFKLNGHPVFAKGANYIPQHSFLSEVTDADYEKLIDMAAKSNMNMLRVWGGGIYEKDIFYELCARKGIMVWQDFMFACAMYPGDSAFLDNVKTEAVYQVKRLRKHTNIALWCGNNEVDEAWHNWGWQKAVNMSPADSAFIWGSYLEIFHNILPKSVELYDNGRAYVTTSPLYGWGREQSMYQADSHYWGVWWGLQPFETYLEKVPRFMSEFGFQALPSLSTIRYFQSEYADSLYSPSLRCHQKHPTGFETIATYIERENLKPSDLKQLIYFSQIVQAHGIGMGIEAQRRDKPRCMGSLYWQLNDCWPVVSWSGTDVFGNWKALQYKVRELFRDVMVSVILNNGNAEVFVVSDKLLDVKGELTIQLRNFVGDTIVLKKQKILLPANASLDVFNVPVGEILKEKSPSQWCLEASFVTEEDSYSNSSFLDLFGNLQLPETKIIRDVKKVEDGFMIALQSDAFAAFVFLFLNNDHAWFEDNFFHLLPGEKREVFCKSSLTLDEFVKQLEVTHLKDNI